MSHLRPWGRARRATGRLARTSAAVVALAALATVTTACPGSTGSTSDLCSVWDVVTAGAPTGTAVQLKSGVVALSNTASTVGASCNAAGATVRLANATVAEGKVVPSEENRPASAPFVAVTGEVLAAQEPVLDNVSLSSLNVELSSAGITASGTVLVRLSGVTSAIGFRGTLTDLQNWSFSLSSSAFTVPGITTSPATFSGSLVVKAGVPTLTLEAGATAAQIGDLRLSAAAIKVVASPATGVDATVRGTLAVGPSSATATARLQLDARGNLVLADAGVNVSLAGVQADGSRIDLTGAVTFTANSDQTDATFTGHGIVGDLVVGEATGRLTLGYDSATLVGVLDVSSAAGFNGRMDAVLVWQGSGASAPYLAAQGQGHFAGALTNGDSVDINGTVRLEGANGQLTAVVDGTVAIGAITARGTTRVELQQTSAVARIDAALTVPGIAGRLTGTAVLTDGAAIAVDVRAGVDVGFRFGDLDIAAGAAFKVVSNASAPLDITLTGNVAIGPGLVSGTANAHAAFGPEGLIAITGRFDGTANIAGWYVSRLGGTLDVGPGRVTVTGGAAVSSCNMSATLDGSLTSAGGVATWSLEGTAGLRIGPFNIQSARFRLAQDGMQVTHVGFYFNLLFIPLYVEVGAKLEQSNQKGVVDVWLDRADPIVRPIVEPAVKRLLGCPV